MEIDVTPIVEQAEQAVGRMVENLEALGLPFTGNVKTAFVLEDGALLECDAVIEGSNTQ